MKFLEIGKDTYINVDRIDGIAVEDINKVKVYVGGSDTPWVVDKSYENKLLEWIHGERDKECPECKAKMEELTGSED